MTITEMDLKVQEIREIQSMIAELEAELEAAKDTIKAEMIERGSEVLTRNGWKASWKVVTSSRLDTKALKADHPDLYTEYSKPSTTSRFVLA